MKSNDGNADVNLYDVLLAAGMDINGLKMMMEYKKSTTEKFKENHRKINDLNQRKWLKTHQKNQYLDINDQYRLKLKKFY